VAINAYSVVTTEDVTLSALRRLGRPAPVSVSDVQEALRDLGSPHGQLGTVPPRSTVRGALDRLHGRGLVAYALAEDGRTRIWLTLPGA
jgi:hypothetical protein